VPLILLSCAWVVGIFLGTEFNLPPVLAITGLAPILLLAFTRRHRKTVILTGLSLIILFAAAAYAHSSLHTVSESSLRSYNDRGVTEIRGIVAGDPDVRDKSTHLHLQASAIKLEGEWQKAAGTALLFVPRYPAYRYGDVLRVTGEPETPSSFDDFDYQGYLAHQGIYTVMPYPEIAIEERGRGFKPLAWVYALRKDVAQTLSTVLPEPQASLAQGIILGIRGNIPPSIKADFTRTGTAHLLAISGLHLGIIAGILISAGIWLFGRRHYLYIWLALGIIWLYAILTGLHPPVVRGAIMASLFLAAELLGRQRSAITALTFAAAIMVGLSPYILGDAAFRLSFLAMAGLVFLFPPFRALGRKAVRAALGEDGVLVTAAGMATDSLSATMAAVIAVWPVVAYYFGIISFVGPLATFLALPALPGIIIAGALTGGLGFIALPAAQAAGWLAWLFLSYMLLVISGLGASSLSFIEVGPVSAALIWAYYLALAAAIFLGRKKPANPVPGATARLKSGISRTGSFAAGLPKRWIIPPLLAAALLVSITTATLPDDNLHVSFLDVGQGDAVFIQQGSRQVLVDGGPSPQALNLALGRQMPFWDRTIDLVVLTHPDYDHLAGLVEVLRRFRVKQVLFTDTDYASPTYDEWQRLITEKEVKSTVARAGQQIDLGQGAVMAVLNPRPAPLTGAGVDMDNNSIVLRLGRGNLSFLLTADIRQEAELELMAARAELNSTVLKVAHHGSDTSTTPEFLAVVDPRLAVISMGEDNRFGHPSDEVRERLTARLGPENIYRTDRQGTIEFITDGERLWVEVGR